MKRAPKAWTEAQLKKAYGAEYPQALVSDAVRYLLHDERRFVRVFSRSDKKSFTCISRFMDGSAGITLAELADEWPNWEERDRIDFCGTCSWLGGQEDFPEMLRYIMNSGELDDWSGIALAAAHELPEDEAFKFLLKALQTAEPGKRANLAQGLAHTKHPDAASVLREHLHTTMSHPSVWDDDRFLNWIAYDAITCINHLIEELGVSPTELEPQIQRLSDHVSQGTRESCRDHLSKHFPWLKDGQSD